MLTMNERDFINKTVHPDIAEPISVSSIPDHNDIFHKSAKVNHKNKPYIGKQIELDGLVIRHIETEEFDMHYTFSGHIIELNLPRSFSHLALNSDKFKDQTFEENTVCYFQQGCELKRLSPDPDKIENATKMIALIIEPEHFESMAYELTDGAVPYFVDYAFPMKMPSLYRAQSALNAMFMRPERYCKLTAEFVVNDIMMRSLHKFSNITGLSDNKLIVSDDRQVNRAIEFIHANLTQAISLKEISRISGLSSGRMTSTFRHATGDTPHNYIIKTRVNQIKEKLRTSDESIASLADKYCFSSASHLSNAFRKYVGDTPSNYRKNFK